MTVRPMTKVSIVRRTGYLCLTNLLMTAASCRAFTTTGKSGSGPEGDIQARRFRVTTAGDHKSLCSKSDWTSCGKHALVGGKQDAPPCRTR